MGDSNIAAIKAKAEKILKEIERFEFCCDHITDRMDMVKKHVYEILYEAEEMPLLARRLPYSLPFGDDFSTDAEKKLSAYMLKATEITIEMTDEGVLHISLPLLLPKKKERIKTHYIRDTLFAAFQIYEYDLFINGKSAVYKGLKPCFIVIKHLFDDERKNRNWLIDYDNFDQKDAIDAITHYTLGDDNPSLCEIMLCAGHAEKTHTEFYLVPADRFIKWLEKDKENHLITG